MSPALSGADAGHLAVAVGLTCALGFERPRGAPAGDRVFSLIGAGSGVVGIIAAHGAPNAPFRYRVTLLACFLAG